MTKKTEQNLTDIGYYVEIPYSEYFTKAYKQIDLATHWVDESGACHKLTSSLKLVYRWALHEFQSYSVAGKEYYATNEQLANDTALSIETVRKNVKPLLKEMGLLTGTHDKKVFELNKLKGKLISVNHTNKTLPNLSDEQYIERQKLTPEQVKMYIKNKLLLKQLNQMHEAKVKAIRSNMLGDNSEPKGKGFFTMEGASKEAKEDTPPH